MPEVEGTLAIAIMPPGMPQRAPFSQHHFVGGNSIILNMLKNNINEFSVSASTENFDATLERLDQQLDSNKTASLSIEEAEVDGDTLMLSLSIEQFVGHKFPSGFPSRRAWIHLTVTDSSGNIVFESGKPNEDGSITGNDADENANTYEPHYNVITQPDQVQIYESIMNNTDGEVTYTLLRGSGYLKDNRLLPLGFDKQSAGEDIAVYGLAAEDADFTGGADSITYQIDTSGHSGSFTVTVELLYQTIGYQFAADLFTTENEELVDDFAGYFDEADKMPKVITSVSQPVS